MSEPVVNGNHVEIPLAKLAEIKVTDYIREGLDKVAQAEGFVTYDIAVDHGSTIGDGFVGQILKVTIQEQNDSKSLRVLAKIPPESKARREQMGVMRLFKREVYVYNVVLPEFIEFQKERNISKSVGFYNFPKVYFADYSEERDDAIIIMEDLRDSGHRMYDKYKPINYEHSKVFLAALGRFHALSFAMKAKRPEQFEKFKELDDFFTGEGIDGNFIGFLEGSVLKAADCLDANDLKSREKVQKLAQNLLDNMKFCLQPDAAEPFAVVTHGDCWFNNFVFHYKKKDLPDEIALIDWQVTRYCTPVIDLVYFFFICTDQNLRLKHFDELLNIYHNSLRDLLDELGGDTMKQFPFTALLRQLKKFGKLGVITASMAVPMLQTKNEDLPDMDFMAEQLKNKDPAEIEEVMKAYMATMGKNSEAIDQRTRGIVIDAIRYGYL